MTSRAAGGGVQLLTWDPLSRLVQLTSAGVAETYLYDGSGQRVATMGEHTASVFLGASEATDPDTSNSSHGDVTATRFYTSGGATVAVRDATGVGFLFGDVQGSATVMMGAGDPATATVSRNAYAPFGARRGDDNLGTDRGFLGQVEDTTTGLTYLNARYYDPTLGRFLSPDPVLNVADPTTLDPYAYAANNPITYTDASGLAPSCSGLTGTAYKNCSGYASGVANYLTGETTRQVALEHNSAVITKGQALKAMRTEFINTAGGKSTAGPLSLSWRQSVVDGLGGNSIGGQTLAATQFSLDSAKLPSTIVSQAGFNLAQRRWQPGSVTSSAASQSGRILANARGGSTLAWWNRVGGSAALEGAGSAVAGAGLVWGTYDATQQSLDRGEDSGIAVARGSAALASGGLSLLATMSTSAAIGGIAGTAVPVLGNVTGFVVGGIVGVGVFAFSNWFLNNRIDAITYG